jgi:fucose permease
MTYVVDAFGLYSASATTALIVTRCLAGTFLPLVAAPLQERLGWGLSFTAIGGFCLCLAPIPMLVMRYGEKWRKRSEYCRES